MTILEEALKRGDTTLSEYDSKQFLARYGIPVTMERVAASENDAADAAREIGYPVVLKASGSQFAHKTEMNLIALDLRTEPELRDAYKKMTGNPAAVVTEVLIQQMVKGDRELVVGMTRDEQFGPCVMFGLGGIFTEILEDVAFRVAPLSRWDAHDMMEDIRSRKILDAIRGKPAVDREKLADILIAVGTIGMEHDVIKEIDINPLVVADGIPVAVDALVVLDESR